MSDALKYLRRLVVDRKEEIPLGHVDLTELGWCTAVVLTLRQAGFDAELMHGKALAYRIPGATTAPEYQDEFDFHFIAVDGNTLPWPGNTADMLGNEDVHDIARAAAHDRHWEYVENCRLRYALAHAEAPSSAEQDMQEYYQRIYRQLAGHLATVMAEELTQSVDAIASPHSRTPRL